MTDVTISVGSATEFENLIAEIKFGTTAGIIISKEPADTEYKISFHSFCNNSAENFDYNRNDPSEKLNLRAVVSAIEEGVARLNKLDEPPP